MARSLKFWIWKVEELCSENKGADQLLKFMPMQKFMSMQKVNLLMTRLKCSYHDDDEEYGVPFYYLFPIFGYP